MTPSPAPATGEPGTTRPMMPAPPAGMPLRDWFLAFADGHFGEADWYSAYILMWDIIARRSATSGGG